jgi:hypothetical protein
MANSRLCFTCILWRIDRVTESPVPVSDAPGNSQTNPAQKYITSNRLQMAFHPYAESAGYWPFLGRGPDAKLQGWTRV